MREILMRQYKVRNRALRDLKSGEITQLLIFQTLQILFFDELVDRSLDISRLWLEARRELHNGLLHQMYVLHLLARFHDANDGRLYR